MVMMMLLMMQMVTILRASPSRSPPQLFAHWLLVSPTHALAQSLFANIAGTANGYPMVAIHWLWRAALGCCVVALQPITVWQRFRLCVRLSCVLQHGLHCNVICGRRVAVIVKFRRHACALWRLMP